MKIKNINSPPLQTEKVKVKIAIIVSTYNREVTLSLEKKCLETLLKDGVPKNHIKIYLVPGAFEIPVIAKNHID